MTSIVPGPGARQNWTGQQPAIPPECVHCGQVLITCPCCGQWADLQWKRHCPSSGTGLHVMRRYPCRRSRWTVTAHVSSLLAGQIAEHPSLVALPWSIWQPDLATASTFPLAGMHREGSTLVIRPAPDVLPLVEELHAAGWQRGGELEQWGWHLSATLTRDGLTLQVSGPTRQQPAGNDGNRPYFAPPPPEIPARGRLPKDFKARLDEWLRKCRDEEW